MANWQVMDEDISEDKLEHSWQYVASNVFFWNVASGIC